MGMDAAEISQTLKVRFASLSPLQKQEQFMWSIETHNLVTKICSTTDKHGYVHTVVANNKPV
jgi:hypothetical protein